MARMRHGTHALKQTTTKSLQLCTELLNNFAESGKEKLILDLREALENSSPSDVEGAFRSVLWFKIIQFIVVESTKEAREMFYVCFFENFI